MRFGRDIGQSIMAGFRFWTEHGCLGLPVLNVAFYHSLNVRNCQKFLRNLLKNQLLINKAIFIYLFFNHCSFYHMIL